MHPKTKPWIEKKQEQSSKSKTRKTQIWDQRDWRAQSISKPETRQRKKKENQTKDNLKQWKPWPNQKWIKSKQYRRTKHDPQNRNKNS